MYIPLPQGQHNFNYDKFDYQKVNKTNPDYENYMTWGKLFS